MKVLFVVPYVPTPIRTRPYNFVRSLASYGEERTQVEDLRRDGFDVVWTSLPLHRSALNCIGALPAEPARHLLFAGAAAFAECVLALLADAEGRAALARAGREYVEANHPWKKIASGLVDVYDMAICEARA